MWIVFNILMLKKFLKEVIILVVGKQAEGIVSLLDGKKYVNEFLIAKKLGITINQTRNILYKISDHGLVSFIRKKDKKKGWYTYFWRIEILKTLKFLRNILLKKIEQINHQIKSRETKQFYVCKRCNIEFTEEHALLNDFTCNECGDIFTTKDNTKELKDFKRNLNKFEKELEFVNEEIKKEEAKIEKIKIKEAKKELKKKEEEKSKRKKAKKVSSKKKVKKKPIKKKLVKKKNKKTKKRIKPNSHKPKKKKIVKKKKLSKK